MFRIWLGLRRSIFGNNSEPIFEPPKVLSHDPDPREGEGRMKCHSCERKFDTEFPELKKLGDTAIALEHINPDSERRNVVHKILVRIYIHDPIPEHTRAQAITPGKGLTERTEG